MLVFLLRFAAFSVAVVAAAAVSGKSSSSSSSLWSLMMFQLLLCSLFLSLGNMDPAEVVKSLTVHI